MVKVLLIDDDEDLLEMMTLMLRSHGMDVISLNDGAMLYHALAERLPDILIMDVFLGNTDGRDLCSALKESKEYTGFPVFLYSAGDLLQASVTDSKADQFFRKPFEMSQLIDRIYKSVSSNQQPTVAAG